MGTGEKFQACNPFLIDFTKENLLMQRILNDMENLKANKVGIFLSFIVWQPNG